MTKLFLTLESIQAAQPTGQMSVAAVAYCPEFNIIRKDWSDIEVQRLSMIT